MLIWKKSVKRGIYLQWHMGGLIALCGLLLPLYMPAAIADAVMSDDENSAVILLYHRFGEDQWPDTNIRLEQFDAQLDYLQQQHFHVWSLSRLVEAIKQHKPIPSKTVVITVDDAWKSVYQAAYPRLKSRGWPMTVFVNTDPVDKGFSSSMTWQQMREMQQHGVEFANHTKTHPVLIQRKNESVDVWRARIRHELDFAQQRLQSELGADANKARLFSYPYGEYSEAVADLVAQIGYVAVSQNSGAVGGRSDLRILLRFPMNEKYGTMDEFKIKVNSLFFPVLKVEPLDPVVGENPPTLTLSFKSPQKNIQCFNHKGEALNQNWLSPIVLQVWNKEKLLPPRDRYACTQLTDSGQWRWFSHPWVIRDEVIR